MECKLHVGQHVVCLRAEPFEDFRPLVPVVVPTVGKVYTVRAIHALPANPSHTAQVGISLEEIPDQTVPVQSPRFPNTLFIGTLYWSHVHFKPLDRLTPEMFQTTEAPVRETEKA